ncbi:hypothetical protein BDV24DRAFT_170112 [Aspergillus arachidicola]|uniref:Uncharacterized protein n=1 Tax=Aspergillus arachidicola TaxID=656916 RepID=A0A5N6XMW6_9EURO|nr:hypothetical protein BDV24DRAFT_170112 [Aspergillus arachidicola]
MYSSKTLVPNPRNHGPEGASDLDLHSIKLLRGRSPVCCADDYRYISRLITDRDLFPSIQDPAKREGIKYRALSIPIIILSWDTFVKDTRYLLPCARAMRRFIPDAPEEAIQASSWAGSQPGQEHSAGRSVFLEAYRTLWQFTMQCFPELGMGQPLHNGHGCDPEI